MAGDTQLRSKKKLIENFIQNNLPNITDKNEVQKEFKQYWDIETKKALQQLCEVEKLNTEKVDKIISTYLFTERTPKEDNIIKALHQQPSILERETISQRITDKILNFVKTFIDGM